MHVFAKAPGATEAFVAIPLLYKPPMLGFSIVSFIYDNSPFIMVDLLLRQNQIWRILSGKAAGQCQLMAIWIKL